MDDFFGTLFAIIVIVALAFFVLSSDSEDEPTNSKEQISCTGPDFQPKSFLIKGKGSSEAAACENADGAAQEECPYGAEKCRKSSHKLAWEKPLLFGDPYWSCKAEYVCKPALSD